MQTIDFIVLGFLTEKYLLNNDIFCSGCFLCSAINSFHATSSEEVRYIDVFLPPPLKKILD